jgi:hypothetical protein
MAWRKWVVRGLVLTIAAAVGAGGIAYQHWTNPAEVRRQLLDQLTARFPGATVTAESARLRLLGGIAVSELRMTRRDDADLTNCLHVPSAVIYHDKELLLDRKFVIRRMVLERPRLRAIRDSDGRWNLEGIAALPEKKERVPTIIVRQGTILVEDRRASGGPPLEIKDVSLTIIEDADADVTWEGCGVSEASGPVQISGRWQRDGGRIEMTCDAAAVPVGPALMQHLAGVCPEIADNARELCGRGNLHATFDRRGEAWNHDVTFSLTQGSFSHPQLPLPLDGVTAFLHCNNGHIARAEASGRAGAAAVRVTVDDICLPCGCKGGESCPVDKLFQKLEVTIDDVPVWEWLQHLPEKFRQMRQRYAPHGPMNVKCVAWHDESGRLRKRLTLWPQQMSASFEKFPYVLERITGNIVHNSCPGQPDQLNIDLVGHAGAEPVGIKATVTGTEPDWTFELDVWGNNIALDRKLLNALLEPKHRTLAESFRPEGLGDFHVRSDWRRDPSRHNGGYFDNHYYIKFHDAAAEYVKFPFRLEHVEGELDIRRSGWEFRNFHGTHGGCTFFTDGHSVGKDSAEVGIHGRAVCLDDDLQRAIIKDELKHVWATFRPEGRIDFDGTVHIGPGDDRDSAPEIALTVRWPTGCRVTPRFFPYALDLQRGTVRYERETVELKDIVASHNGTVVDLERGKVELRPKGGYRADLVSLRANPLVTDRDFLEAMVGTPGLQRAVSALAVDGPLEVRTRLYIDAPPGAERPRIYWDGSASLNDTTVHTGVAMEHVKGSVAMRGWHNGQQIERAAGNLDVQELTIFNQPVRDLRGEIVVTDDEPEVVKFPGLLAQYFGGQIFGPLRLELGPRLRYRLDLTAAQVRLEEFGRRNFNNSDLKGLAVAQLYLEGEGGELSGLKGNGRIDVPNGRMYNLPLLLDLLKFLGLRLPDRTAFEEAHVVFDIEGKRAHVKQLELYGNAISLRGSGDADIDGSDLAFAFYLDWARLGQILPAGVREVPREISNQLFRIDMRGRVGDVHFREVPVPLLLTPLKKAFGGEDEGRWDLPQKNR